MYRDRKRNTHDLEQMKRKRPRQGLETDPLVPDETAQTLSQTADSHLNALRKGYARSSASQHAVEY